MLTPPPPMKERETSSIRELQQRMDIGCADCHPGRRCKTCPTFPLLFIYNSPI